MSACGECQACCVTLYIASGGDWPWPAKRSHQACHHCTGSGCNIFARRLRPRFCHTFECLWLKSQLSDDPMSAEMRPDRSGVILTGPEPGDPDDLFYVHPDVTIERPYDREPVYSYLKRVQANGQRARLVTYYHGETL